MIKCENLRFSYDGTNNALCDISLDVGKGEFVAILGANGSGKSTFARCLNALIIPSDGDVYINGINTRDVSRVQEIRKTAGMVFQNPDNQLVATVVEEDVAFGPENLCVPPDEIRDRVKDALERVDMWDMRKSAPHRLSGGQKQRVAIAGVLAMRPDLVVLDEPTAMLDPMGRREVMQTILMLKGRGITVVLITHFMEEAAQADRVIVFDRGRISMDDTPRAVFAHHEELTALGLCTPAITQLAHHLRQGGIPMGIALDSDEFMRDPAILQLIGSGASA